MWDWKVSKNILDKIKQNLSDVIGINQRKNANKYYMNSFSSIKDTPQEKQYNSIQSIRDNIFNKALNMLK